MKKYALIGKNISHSRSPEMYSRLIHHEFKYELLDFATEENLPSIESLKLKYDGINITAPYKRSYYSDVVLDEAAMKTGAINCIKFKNNEAYATNTDYTAFKRLFFQKNLQEFETIVILGDGAMAEMLKVALTDLGKKYFQYSRKKNGALENLRIQDLHSGQILIINCCSRNFVFKEKLLEPSSLFYDMNYSNLNQSDIFSNNPQQYYDGLDLLFEQARDAIVFWSNI